MTTSLLRQLHWLKAPEWIDYKFALLVHKCLQGVVPLILPCRRPVPAGRRRGSTWSTFSLVTISGCVLYVAVYVRRPSFPGRRLASLEQSATSRHVCSVTACFFCSRLKTHLFRNSFPSLYCCAREVTLVIMNTLIVVLTYLFIYFIADTDRRITDTWPQHIVLAYRDSIGRAAKLKVIFLI